MYFATMHKTRPLILSQSDKETRINPVYIQSKKYSREQIGPRTALQGLKLHMKKKKELPCANEMIDCAAHQQITQASSD